MPKDQGLFFSIFAGVFIPLILLFWIVIPPVSPHLDDEEGGVQVLKPLTREGTIFRAESIIMQVGEKLTNLEEEAEEKLKEAEEAEEKLKEAEEAEEKLKEAEEEEEEEEEIRVE